MNFTYQQQRIDAAKVETLECVEDFHSEEMGCHKKIETINFLVSVFLDSDDGDKSDWDKETIKDTVRSAGELVTFLANIDRLQNTIRHFQGQIDQEEMRKAGAFAD